MSKETLNERQPMSDEHYKDFKRELSKKSAFKDFAKALDNPVPYYDKGGHLKRSTYWKNLKAIKSVEDEAWEFAEKINQLKVGSNEDSVVNKVVK